MKRGRQGDRALLMGCPLASATHRLDLRRLGELGRQRECGPVVVSFPVQSGTATGDKDIRGGKPNGPSKMQISHEGHVCRDQVREEQAQAH